MFLLMHIFSLKYAYSKNANIAHSDNSFFYIVLTILVFCLIMALRYGVGVDFFAYQAAYKNGNYIPSNWNSGFLFIVNFCKCFGLPYSCFLALVAFLQVFPIFYVFRKLVDLKIYIYLVFALVFTGSWLGMCNTLRQWIAVSIGFYCFSFLNKKQWQYFIIGVLLCMTFHTSAIIMLPLIVYAFYGPFFNDAKIKVVLLLVSVFVGNLLEGSSLFEFFNQYFFATDFAESSGYNYYSWSNDYWDADVQKGAGYILKIVSLIYIFAYSEDVKKFYKSRWISVLYDIFFIGSLLNNIFISVHILSRMTMYFSGFYFVFIALSIRVSSKLGHSFIFYLMVFCTLLFFIAVMYKADTNTAQYFFIWQQNQVKPNI